MYIIYIHVHVVELNITLELLMFMQALQILIYVVVHACDITIRPDIMVCQYCWFSGVPLRNIIK